MWPIHYWLEQSWSADPSEIATELIGSWTWMCCPSQSGPFGWKSVPTIDAADGGSKTLSQNLAGSELSIEHTEKWSVWGTAFEKAVPSFFFSATSQPEHRYDQNH